MTREEILEELAEAAKDFVDNEVKVHQVFGSTATCSGRVGGQATTSHCSWSCPNSTHDIDQHSYTMSLRRLRAALYNLSESSKHPE